MTIGPIWRLKREQFRPFHEVVSAECLECRTNRGVQIRMIVDVADTSRRNESRSKGMSSGALLIHNLLS